MFLANEEKVYILDKAEGNAEKINGHPAWGAVWWVHNRCFSISSRIQAPLIQGYRYQRCGHYGHLLQHFLRLWNASP